MLSTTPAQLAGEPKGGRGGSLNLFTTRLKQFYESVLTLVVSDPDLWRLGYPDGSTSISPPILRW